MDNRRFRALRPARPPATGDCITHACAAAAALLRSDDAQSFLHFEKGSMFVSFETALKSAAVCLPQVLAALNVAFTYVACGATKTCKVIVISVPLQ